MALEQVMIDQQGVPGGSGERCHRGNSVEEVGVRELQEWSTTRAQPAPDWGGWLRASRRAAGRV